jgi:hypothetical protein
VRQKAESVIPEQVAFDGRQWKMLFLCTFESIPGARTDKQL